MPADTAFILRAVNYKESDRIFTLYTRELGKISAIAKGARKSARRFGGALQPFALFETTLNRSRRGSSDMYLISDATLLRDNGGLAGDLPRLGVAGFLLELIREAAPEHESNASLFDLGADSLRLLSDDASLFPRSLMLSSGLRILAKSGLAMSVSRCNACGTEIPKGKRAYFDALRGGVVCTPCGGGPLLLEADTVESFIFLTQNPIEASAHFQIERETLEEMEAAFEAYIHVQLEKQLKTTGFITQVTDGN